MRETTGHQALWGRCPAPTLNFNHNLLGQGTSIADHQMRLRLFKPIMQLKTDTQSNLHIAALL